MDEAFEEEKRGNALAMAKDESLRQAVGRVMDGVAEHKYTYNFTWLGLPMIQLPSDVLALQELVWRIKPDLIVETGVARGGSLIFHASLLELIGGRGQVVGVDIDIRRPQRDMIEAHPLFKRITLIEGSSIEETTVAKVRDLASSAETVLVTLDSNHTHDHVLRELQLYSPLVGKGSYLVVMDTVIADMPEEALAGRPWSREQNPKTAVHEFLRSCKRFSIDRELEAKLLMTNAPDGFLRCTKDE